LSLFFLQHNTMNPYEAKDASHGPVELLQCHLLLKYQYVCKLEKDLFKNVVLANHMYHCKQQMTLGMYFLCTYIHGVTF
jgi:hypothetical protein